MRVMELKKTATALFATGAIALASAVPATAQDTTSEPMGGYGTVEDLCAWAHATPDMGEETTADESPAVDMGEETTADESPAADMGEETTADGLASVDAALLRELCDRAGLTADMAGGETPTGTDSSPLPTVVDPSPGMSPGIEGEESDS